MQGQGYNSKSAALFFKSAALFFLVLVFCFCASALRPIWASPAVHDCGLGAAVLSRSRRVVSMCSPPPVRWLRVMEASVSPAAPDPDDWVLSPAPAFPGVSHRFACRDLGGSLPLFLMHSSSRLHTHGLRAPPSANS